MQRALFFFLVLGIFAGVCPPADAIASDLSTLKMTVSANENYLRRFRKEREALEQASDAASIKKRDGLDKKIKNLEDENARLTGVLQKNGGQAPTTPLAVKPPAASAVVPVALEPKPVAAVEPLPEKPRATLNYAPETPVTPPSPGSAIAEWEKMSREKKESYVQDLVNTLKREGRSIQRHPLFYTALMDYVFVSDSGLAAKPLRDAVIATIQKNEKTFA